MAHGDSTTRNKMNKVNAKKQYFANTLILLNLSTKTGLEGKHSRSSTLTSWLPRTNKFHHPIQSKASANARAAQWRSRDRPASVQSAILRFRRSRKKTLELVSCLGTRCLLPPCPAVARGSRWQRSPSSRPRQP